MRSLPVGLAELLRGGWAESHSTLELTVSPLNEPARTYYLATSPITVNGVAHDAYLRETGSVRYSLTAAADRTDAAIENASAIFGEDFIGRPDALHGATARLGRYWRDLQSGAEFHVYLLSGVVTGGTANASTVQLTLTSDLYAKTSKGGGRIVSRLCQNGFRDGIGCTYSGAELLCNKRHTDADGCSGRSNTHQYTGFIYIESKAATAGAAGTATPAANQSVSDGSSQYAMQPYIEFTGATITNNTGTNTTEIAFSASATGTEAVINVKDSPYSATGDGTTDDTSAIASAVTAAISAGKPLYFPPGTYKANITGLTNGMKLFGAGPTDSIIKAPNSTSAVIEITSASMHTLEIADLGIQGFGSGSANHGLYIHDNTFEAYLVRLDRVKVWDCGGKGVYVDGHFTTHMSHVEITNCGDNAFDFSGNNTNYFSHCYVDDLAANKVAYRIRAGQVVLINCNGVDSLGTGTSWGVFGDLLADDGRDAYCDATLIGCNVESAYTGVYAKSGSRVSLYNTFFTTGTSGAHVAVKTAYTNNQPGIIDATCRFNTQGTATWSNSQAIHGTDAPLIQIGRQHATQYYDTSGATSRDLPAVAVTSLSSTPNCYTPRYAIDRLTVQTSLAMTGGALATQAGTIAGALGWTITNSNTNSAAYAGIDLANNAGATGFIRLYASATGIFQVGSDNYDVYFKSNGNNRWYVGNTVFGPLQDNTSDLGSASVRVKDAYLAGSLNFAERTAPGTPSTGSIVVYAKDKSGVSALYMKDDAGTETEIGAASTPSLTSTRVAFGSGSNLLTESADFTYNDTSKALTIGNNSSGTGVVNVRGLGGGTAVVIRSASAPGTQGGLVLPFEGGEISYGPGIWWTSSASYGTTSGLFLNSGLNFQGAGSTHTQLKLRKSTGTSSLGSIVFTFSPDSGYLEFAPFGTSAGNTSEARFLELAANGTSYVSIKSPDALSATVGLTLPSALPAADDRPMVSTSAGVLSFATQLRLDRMLTAGSAPSTSAGSGAGTGPTITIDGNEYAGALLVTTGTSPAANAQIVDVTVSTAANYPMVYLTPGNAATAALSGANQVFISDADATATKWRLKSGSTGLTASTDYIWYYQMVRFV